MKMELASAITAKDAPCVWARERHRYFGGGGCVAAMFGRDISVDGCRDF
jgi:hypothetical protein